MMMRPITSKAETAITGAFHSHPSELPSLSEDTGSAPDRRGGGGGGGAGGEGGGEGGGGEGGGGGGEGGGGLDGGGGARWRKLSPKDVAFTSLVMPKLFVVSPRLTSSIASSADSILAMVFVVSGDPGKLCSIGSKVVTSISTKLVPSRFVQYTWFGCSPISWDIT